MIQFYVNTEYCAKCCANLNFAGIGMLAPFGGANMTGPGVMNAPGAVLCVTCARPYCDQVEADSQLWGQLPSGDSEPFSPCCQASTFAVGNQRVCSKCRLTRPI